MSIKDLKAKFTKGLLSKTDYIEKMHVEHQILFDYAEFIKDTDIGKIEITDGTIHMTTREHSVKFLVDKDDTRFIPVEILNFGTYEKSQMKMISNLVQDGTTILDVGGNIGWFSLTLARLKNNVKIYAFEPIPKTFDYLTQNIQLNHADQIKCFNIGFSNFEGTIPFYYYSEGSGNASMVNVSERADVEIQECQVMLLDEFVGKNNLNIDFIKCDVEGAELFVFQGAAETLKTHKPVIATEMLRKWAAKYDYHPNEIISFLSELGYRCFTTDGQHLIPFSVMNESSVETNYFFLHGDKHRGLMEKHVLK